MSQNQQKYTGTQYAPTAAALIGGLIFTPAVVFASRPFGYPSVLFALLCSLCCLGAAWLSWKKAELTVPTIEPLFVRAR